MLQSRNLSALFARATLAPDGLTGGMDKKKRRRSKAQPIALEQRMMFDAALAATAADVAQDSHAETTLPTAEPTVGTDLTDVLGQDQTAPEAPAVETEPATTVEALTTAPATSQDRKEVAFVDTSVADYQTLIDGIKEGVEVVLIDGSKDGLAQMAEWAEGKSGYDAIHVLSHGAEGQVTLGSMTLNQTTLESRADDLAALGAALSGDGDLLLYGCRVAGGEGQAFIAAMAQATGTDVAASVDDTGALIKGGDWVLESAAGSIETSTALSDRGQSAFTGLLATEDFSTLAISTSTVQSSPVTLNSIQYSIDGNGSFLRGNAETFFGYTYSNFSGNALLGGVTSGLSWDNTVTTTAVTIQATSLASNFYLSAFDIAFADSNAATTVTIQGYEGGTGGTKTAEVTGVDGTAAGTTAYAASTVNAVSATKASSNGAAMLVSLSGTGWQNVDTIVITGTNGYFSFALDNLVFDAPVVAGPVAPTLTATGVGTAFIEGEGGGVDVFAGVTADTGDGSETFTGATLTVTNVADTTEYLIVGGTQVALADATSGTIAGVGSYAVSVASGTATVTLSGMTASNAQMVGLIDGIQYYNADASVTAGNRVVTLTGIADSGASNNSAVLNIATTIIVVDVSNAPLVVNVGTDSDSIGSSLNDDLTDNGGLTLREAMHWADSTAGADTIELQKNVTLDAANFDLPFIKGYTLIKGNGFKIDGAAYAGFSMGEESGSRMVLEDLELTNFSDDNNFFAGAVFLSLNTPGTLSAAIRDVSFYGNNSTGGVGGGVVSVSADTATTLILIDIQNSIFYDNDVTNNKGIIAVNSSNLGTAVVNVTSSAIYDNSGPAAIDAYTLGAGNSIYMNVSNSSVAGNLVGVNLDPAGGSISVNLLNSIVVDNTTANIVGSTNSQSSLTTNSSINFVNSGSGDYRLAATASNALNVGDAYYLTGSLDVRGLQRIRNSTVDIGAYESWLNGTAPAVDLDSTTGGNDYTNPANSGFAAGITVVESGATITQSDSETRIWKMSAALTDNVDGMSGGDETLFLSDAHLLAAQQSGISVAGNGTATLTFTGGETLAAFQTVLRNIQYKNVAGTPTPGDRTVTVTVDDDAAASAIATISVSAGPAAPVITNLNGGTLTYTADSGARVIDQGTIVAVTDTDSTDFDTGTLTVAVTGVTADDVLGIRNQGSSAGLIGVSGSNITYGGTTIGSFTGGSGSDLVVTFNANATPPAVSALLANVTYSTTSTANASRTVSFTMADGDGQTSTAATVTIAVSADTTGTIYTVSTLDDSSNNATIGADLAADTADGGGLSLREAIHWSNQNAGADTIVFQSSLSGTIRLSAVLPTITQGLRIFGNGSDTITINGDTDNDNTPDVAWMYIDDGVGNTNQDVLISGLSFTRGKAFLQYSNYGAIVSAENLTLEGTSFSFVLGDGNSAGNAVVVDAQDYIVSLTAPSLTVRNSTFSNLQNAIGVGAGPVIIENSRFTDALVNSGETNANQGYLNLFAGSAIIRNNEFSNLNLSATNMESAFIVNFADSANSSALIVNNTFNSIAFGSTGNGTINVSEDGTNGQTHNITIQNNTLYGNTNTRTGSEHQQILVGSVATGAPDTVTISNNIAVSGSSANTTVNIIGSSTSSVSNSVVGTISGADTITSNSTTDPSPGAIANNGGPTQTQAIGSGSSATNLGTSAGAPTIDQRGFVRNVGNPDAGAYEYGSTQFQFIGQSRPLDGAVGVAVTSNIVLDFGHTLAKGTGSIRIYNADTNALLQTIDVTSGDVTLSGSRATINPSDLPSSANIYVEVDAGAFTTSVDGGTNNATSVVMRDATGISFRTTAVAGPVAPTLTATGIGTPFIEGEGGGVDVFAGVTADTGDGSETFTGATLTVTNVADTTEYLIIAGTQVALTDATSGTIAGVGSYAVSVTTGTATVTLSGLTASNDQMSGLIDGIQYYNADASVVAGNRVITLTTVTDSGGSNNSGAANIAATVSVVASNAVMTVTLSGDADTGGDNTDLAGDIADGGGLTLREAFYWANNTAGADTIKLATNVVLDIMVSADLGGLTESIILKGDGFKIDGGTGSGFNTETIGTKIVVERTEFYNFADQGFAGYGVLALLGNATTSNVSLTVRDSIFHDNVSDTGAILLRTQTAEDKTLSLQVERSIFYSNSNVGVLGGSAITLGDTGLANGQTTNDHWTGIVTITDSLFYDNTGSVGAVSVMGVGTMPTLYAHISNSTITGNSDGVVMSGGIVGSTFSLFNSVVTDNTSTNVTGQPSSSGANLTTNSSVTFVNAGSDDYRLAASEADALNQGDAHYITGTLDVRRLERIRNSTVDIGAYESYLSGAAPVVDLDSTTGGNDYTNSATSGFNTGITVVESGATITQSDGETRIWKMSAVLTDNVDGMSGGDETLFLSDAHLLAAQQSGITVTGNGTATLTFTGGETLAAFQTVLRNIQYKNVAGTPTSGDRTVTVTVDDDAAASAVVTLSVSTNTTLTVSNLTTNSVAWAGVGSAVVLDDGFDAVVAHATFDLLNTGNGDWSGASLTFQRSNSAVTTDSFGFNTDPISSIAALFTVSGNTLQSGGQTFATFTSTGGVLTVAFAGDGTNGTAIPTKALVQDVLRRVTFGTDSPTGNMSLDYSLSDGTVAATGTVAVTSNVITVNATGEVSDNDRNSITLREAVAIAAAQSAGAETLVFSSALASQTITLASGLTIGESLTMDADAAAGLTITGSTITLGATLTITNGTSDTATISSAIAGSGVGLTKTGAGTLTLSGSNSYSGTTTVSAGTLELGGGAAITNSGAISVSSNATLALNASETIGTLDGTGAVTLGANTLTIGSGDGSGTFSGLISGSGGGITKVGTGTLTLSGTNSYTGSTTVSAGTLAVSGGSAIADSSAVTVDSGATLSLTLGGETIGSLAGAGSVSLSYNLTVGDATNTTFSGIISSTNTSGLTKVGPGTLTLTGANTYTGATTISAGGLTLNKSGGALADTTAVTVASGATLTVTTNDTIGSLAGAGTVALGSSLLTFGGSNTSTTFSGTITGATGGSIKKLGTGVFTLSGTNTYIGGTDLAAGTIVAGAVGALGSGGISFSADTTLDLAASGTFTNYIDLPANATINVRTDISATLSNVVDGAGNLTKTGAGTLTLSGTNSSGHSGTISVLAGTLSIGGDDNLGSGALTLNGGTLLITDAASIDNAVVLGVNSGTITNADAVTLSGTLSGTGNLTKTGAGTLTLSGTQTATGAMNVTAGTVAVAADANLLGGEITLAGGNLSITGATTIDNAIALSSAGTITNSAAATLSGVISGSGAVTKTGAGVLTLSGTQTATGGLSVTGGTVKISAAANMVGGTLTLDGGTLDVGDNNLTLGNALAIGSTGGTINVDTVNNNGLTLSGAITGSGTLSKTGTDVVYFANASGFTGALDVQAGSIVATGSSTFGSGQITLATSTNLGVAGSTRSIANNIVLAGNAALYTGQPTDTTNGETITFSGVVSGAGNLTIIGATSPAGNLVVLSGINTYTGTTTLSTGRLSVASDANLGSGALSLAANTTLVISAATTIDNAVALTGLVTVQTNADATLSGVLSGTGNLNKTGTSTLTLTGTQTGTGGIDVRVGTLSVGADGNLLSGTVSLNGGSLTLTGGNIDNAIDLLENATITASADATLSGVISDAGVLTKAGTGTLTLSGTQTATGALNVTAGTVAVAADANLLGGDITLAGGSLSITGATTIDNAIALSSAGTITNSAAATLSGVISGSGLLSKTGTGTLTLSGTQTATGGLSVTGGTVKISAAANMVGGTLTLDGGTLDVGDNNLTLGNALVIGSTGGTINVDTVNNNGLTLSGAITGSGTLSKTGTDVVYFANASSFTGALDVQAGSIVATGSSTFGSGQITLATSTNLGVAGSTRSIANNIVLAGNAALYTGQPTDTSNGETITFSGVISGAGNLTIIGATSPAGNLVVLSGINTYTGTTTLSTGRLSVASDANLGSGALSLADGTTLVISAATSIDNAVTLAGNATVKTDADATLSGALSGTGNLTKTGTSTLTLSGTQTGTGGTHIRGGALSVGADGALLSGTVTLNGGSLTLTGGSIDNVIDLFDNATITASADATLSGVITGAGVLTKAGTGTLTLSGTQTATGAMNVTAGTVAVAADANLLAGEITLAGGNLAITGATTIDNAIGLSSDATITNSAAVTLSGVISGTGNLSKAGTGTLTLSGTQTGTGGLSVSAGTVSVAADANLLGGVITLAGGDLSITGATTIDNAIVLSSTGTITTSADATLSGVLSGTGTLSKAGSSTLTLTGTQTGTGGLVIAAGTLAVAGDANLLGGTITLSGGTLLITGAATIDNALAISAGALNTSGAVTLSGVLSGSGDLSKTGTGTLTLTGAGSAYTNTLTVNGGGLVMNGVLGGSIVMTSGTSLSGSGSIGGSVVAEDGSTVTAGNSPGRLSIGGDLQIDGMLVLELDGTTAGTLYDQLAVTGTVTLNGGTLSLTTSNSFVPVAGDSFTIIDNDGTDGVVGTFGSLAEGAVISINGVIGSLSYVGGSGNDVVLRVNSLPVLDASQSPSLAGVDEDAPAPSNGATGGSVLVTGLTGGLSDVDPSNSLGIAITGVSSLGTLYYSVDGGASWTAVSSVSETAALLLPADANTRLYFKPNAGVNGPITDAITFKGWDGTVGTAGSTADTTSGSAFSTASDTASITIAPVNDAPVVGGLSGITHTEAGGAVLIAPSGTLSDVDSNTLSSLTITLAATPDGAAESLGVLGSLPTGITAGNYDASARSLTLSGVASLADYQAALRQITYANSDQDPDTSARSVSIVAHDGAADSTAGTLSVTVVAVNDAPVLSGGGGSVQATVRDQAYSVGGGLSFSDADNSSFDGGVLTVSITAGGAAAQDVLGVANIGLITVSGNTVSFDGTAIGTLAGGSGGVALSITLNANAGTTAVTALLNAITYTNASSGGALSADDRTLSFALNDGAGGTSSALTTTVQVNQPPSLPVNSGLTVAEGGVLTLTGSLLAAADNEGSTAAQLTYSLTTAPGAGTLFRDTNSNGSVDSGEALAVGGQFTQAEINAGSIKLAHDGSETLSDSFTLSVTDKDGLTLSGQTVAVSITGTNDAPTLTGGSLSVTGTDEDTTSTAVTVASIVAQLGFSDADGNEGGLAIFGSSGNGGWEYSLDGGTSFIALGSVSADAALLLGPTALLRYVPDGRNAESAGLSLRGWDQSVGTAGSTVAANTVGGSSALSAGSASLSLSVTAVNDAPVLTPASPSFDSVGEDETSNAGQTVASLLGSSVTDPDSDASQGLAITGLSSSTGTWQYSLDGGSNWSDVGTVSADTALLLRASDRIRFVPDGQNATSASITYTAWDQSTGTAGNKVAASGGAFSTASDTASISVTASNDAPEAVADSGTTDEASVLTVAAGQGLLANDTDIDSGDSSVVSAVNGVTANVGQTITLASGALLQVNEDGSYSYDPNGAFSGLGSGQQASDSFTYTITDSEGATSTTTVTLTITGVNDQPAAEDAKSVVIARNAGATGLSIEAPTDPDGDVVTVTITTLPGNGSLSKADGSAVELGSVLTALDLSGLRFDPDDGFVGEAGELVYTVSDGTSSVSRAVNITIAEEQMVSIAVKDGTGSTQAEPGTGEANRTYTFVISRTAGLDAATEGSITVSWVIEEGGGIDRFDFAGAVLPSGSITFAAGESSKEITIEVAADGSIEGDETFAVTLTGLDAVGLTLEPRVNDPDSASATILDAETDRVQPKVTGVVAPAAKTYFPGDVISFDLVFSEVVQVGSTTPTVELMIGNQTVLATYSAGSGSNTLTFTYTVLAAQTDADGISIANQLSTASAALITDSAGNSATTSYRLTAPAGTALDLSGVLVNVVSGKSIDGYITGATVYADADRDGVQDSGEVSSITDAAGNYTISGGDGPYIMVGGTDISTGHVFDGVYEAPPRATVINPLTTAIVGVAGLSANDAQFSAAADKVKSALGLASSIDLYTYDPILAATATGASATDVANALKAQGEAAKIANLIVQGSAVLKGAATTTLAAGVAGQAIVDALGAAITALPSGGTINLSDAATIEAIIRDAANRLGTVDIAKVSNVAADAATVVAAGSSSIDSAASSGGTGLAGLEAITKVQVVAQGDAATALQTGTSSGSVSTAVSSYTGTSLDTAVSAATAGTIVPSRISIGVIDAGKSEGDSGTTAFTFQLTRSGGSSGVASVAYQVSGANGLNAADFGGTLPSGTVTFADGETSKTLTILVSGDVTVEGDESFTVTLSNPSTGADIGTAVASGLIIDNDPVATLNVIPTLPAVLAGQTTAITGFDVLDGDSATLTVTVTATNGSLLFVGPATQTAVSGGVRLTGTVEQLANTLNTLRFTANSGATSASIRMVSTDGTNTDDDTVSLRIASSPVNVLPVRPTVVGGRATEIIGIGVTDTDSTNLTVTLTPGNGAITFTRFGSVAVTTLAGGVQQLSGSKADVAASLATVTFTAVTGVTTATLRIATDDGDATTPNDSDLITIDVVQPTINTVPASAVVLAGSATAVTGLSVSDTDSTNLSVTLTPTNGTVAVTLAGSATLTQVSAAVIRINGTAADINSSLASLRFTAQTGVTSASLRMVSSDDDSRTPDTTSTIPLTVRSSSVVTLPGALSPVAPGGVVNLGALSVSDTDSASLTVTLTPTGGTLALTGTNGVTVNQVNGIYTLTGSPAAISQTLASLTLTAGSGVVESSVRVQISDGDAFTPDVDQTLRVSVYSAPVITAPSTQPVSSTASTALTGITVSDVDSTSLSVTITPTDGTLTATAKGSASLTQSGGVYTLTGSPADINATLATLAFSANVGATSASVTVSVSDGDARTTDPSQTISLAVVGSEPPSAGGDVVVTAPSGAAVSIVEDSSADTANIRISPTTLADDGGIPPTSIRILSVTGGTLLDANGNAITFGVGGTLLTLTNGGVDLRFTPDANRASAASFQYVVVDPTFTGLNSPASTATISMTPVNDAPVAGNHSGAPVNDTALSVAAGVGLLSTASDIDGTDTLVVSAVNGNAAAVGQTITLPSGASLRVNEDGSYVYTPGGAAYRALGVGQTGSDSFTYTVSDGAGGTSTASVTLTLTGVNDTPTVGGSTAAVSQGSTVGISQASLLALAADVDSGDTLSLSAVNGSALAAGQTLTLPSGALLFRDANGNFSYNPNGAFQSLAQGQTTTDSFTYTVRDASGATSTATMVVTVTGANDAPVATGVELSLATQPAQAGAQYSAQLPDGLFSDIDAGDSLSLSLSGLPEGYSFDATTRTISGVGTGLSVGRHILTLTATDSQGATVSRTVELVVREAPTPPLPAPTPINDNPVGNRLTVIDTSIAPVLVVAPSVDGANLSSGSIVTGVIGASSVTQIGAGLMDTTHLAFTEPAPLSQERSGFVALTVNGGEGGALFLRLGSSEPRGRLSYDPARNISVFSLPDSTFVTNDSSVSVEARLPDGKPLPSWLKFDARSGTFSVAGKPPAEVKNLLIEVRAVGSDGREAKATLNLNMDSAEAPAAQQGTGEQADGDATPGQQGAVDAKATSKIAIGKAPVSQSIRMASSLAMQDARQGLLDDLAGLFTDLFGTTPTRTAEAAAPNASSNQKAA